MTRNVLEHDDEMLALFKINDVPRFHAYVQETPKKIKLAWESIGKTVKPKKRGYDPNEMVLQIKSQAMTDFLLKHDTEYNRILTKDIKLMSLAEMDKIGNFDDIGTSHFVSEYPEYFQVNVLTKTWMDNGRSLERVSPIAALIARKAEEKMVKKILAMDPVNGTMLMVRRNGDDNLRGIRMHHLPPRSVDDVVDAAMKVPPEASRTNDLKDFITAINENWNDNDDDRKRRARKFLNYPNPAIQRHAVEQLMKKRMTREEDVDLYWFKSIDVVKNEFMNQVLAGRDISCKALEIIRNDIMRKRDLELNVQHFRKHVNRKYNYHNCGERR